MICLPNRKRDLAVSSIRDLVRKRMGAPLTIIISPWRSSKTRLDMRLFLVGRFPHKALRDLTCVPAFCRSPESHPSPDQTFCPVGIRSDVYLNRLISA